LTGRGERQAKGGESGGDRPVDPVAARLYDQLRALAERVLGRGRRSHAVDATDLVHECYLRLARLEDFKMLGKAQFMSLASSLLRSILVDLTRRELALKRGEAWQRTTLVSASESLGGDAREEVDLLDLDAAMKRLEGLDPRQHRIVELRFFGGLTGEEIAQELGISRRMVTKEWTVARAWLQRELER